MKFKVIDNKTGKEADPYEIALHEEWAQGLVYCDMEGFMLTENGDLMLADECGTYVYCDPERFKVVFEDERPHGEWEYTGCVNDELQPEFCCSICNFSTYSRQYNFCPNCGALMISSNSEIEKSKSEIVPDYRDGWRLKEGDEK